MSYTSRRNRRPDEFASKSSHTHIINDKEVQSFLSRCSLPLRSEDIDLFTEQIHSVNPIHDNPIKHVIAIDGGYTEVIVQPAFPSAKIAFFQFGALVFQVSDLEELEIKPFIDPEDMARLKGIKRLKLTLPIRNINFNSAASLTHAVRDALREFFSRNLEFIRTDVKRTLSDALAWLIFEKYRPRDAWVEWNLASCPHCGTKDIKMSADRLDERYAMNCSQCHNEIYLIDVLRLHEAIDDEIGASGILGYVTTAIEQIILVFIVKLLLDTRPRALREVLFIKDGPLAFFGQTANLHKPMRQLVNYLFDTHNFFAAGLEKSGVFVEHADEIADKLDPNSVLIFSNEYIYKYILPGQADPANPYGRTTYYGNKLIYKTAVGDLYLVTLPTKDLMSQPIYESFKNIDVVLGNLAKLRCDMYDSALLPVALVNKLVSLADHPSSAILQNFATGNIR